MRTIIELHESDIMDIVSSYFEKKHNKKDVSAMFRIRKEQREIHGSLHEVIVIQMDVEFPEEQVNG